MPNVRVTVALALTALTLVAASCADESAPDASATAAPIATATPSSDSATPVQIPPGGPGQPGTIAPRPIVADPGYPVVEELAPIERIEVVQTSSVPPQYAVLVVSGLPSGCARYSGYEATGDDTTIRIEVFNTVPAPGELVACTAIYGYHETNIILRSDFDSGVTYTVEVNGVTTQFTPTTGSGATAPPPPEPSASPPRDDPGYATVEELAPIESVEVLTAESFPPQYFVEVVSGLPNGCARFSRYEVERDGTTVRIEVFNTVPAPGELIACTMIYGCQETSIPLGADFDSGVTYTVEVNDVTTEFTAQ